MTTDRLVQGFSVQESGSEARAHFSTLDRARRRSGDAWIQPVAFNQSSSVRRPFDWMLHKKTLSVPYVGNASCFLDHLESGTSVFASFLLIESVSVDSIVWVGVPPCAYCSWLQKPCWVAWNRWLSGGRSWVVVVPIRDLPFIRMLVGNAWRQRWKDLSKGTWTPVRSLFEGGSAERTLPGFHLLFPRPCQATLYGFRWGIICTLNWTVAFVWTAVNTHVTSLIGHSAPKTQKGGPSFTISTLCKFDLHHVSPHYLSSYLLYNFHCNEIHVHGDRLSFSQRAKFEV